MCEYTYIHLCVCECAYDNSVFNSSLQEGTGRPVASNKAVTCAELVLDVSPKTQRVILKKKVRRLRTGVQNERLSVWKKLRSSGLNPGPALHSPGSGDRREDSPRVGAGAAAQATCFPAP